MAQDAFIKAYRALPQFRGESAFYTWLYRIAVNTAKNYLATQGRRAPTSTETNAEDAETFADADQLRDINTPESMLMTKQLRKRSMQRWRCYPRSCAPLLRCVRSRG